jgi:hypothetical protein
MSPMPDQSFAHSNPSRGSVLVYNYYTYLPGPDTVVPVLSAVPATLDLIESLAAVPVLESAQEAHPSQVSELGFFRGPRHSGHD